MDSLFVSEVSQAPSLVQQLPVISLLIPFEPKMMSSSELQQKMKSVLSEVKGRLKEEYSHAEVSEMMLKLNNIVSHLDYHTYKRSVAIFVSPVIEKVYYLDIEVHEKISIDDQFQLRDLVASKKESHQYLVLVLSGEWTRVYLGNGQHFTRVVSNIPEKIDAFKNDIPERVANFSDPSHRREIVLKKFLHYTDNGLKILLEAYPLPLFVMGSEKLLGYFRHLTKNSNNIVGYAKGNFINVPESSIRAAVAPLIADWKLVKQRDLLNRIDAAAGAGKLAIGLSEVLKEAKKKNGRLLVIENNFHETGTLSKSHIFLPDHSKEGIFFIHDVVDQVIEYLLECGGDIEFVEDGALEEYKQIALIKYY